MESDNTRPLRQEGPCVRGKDSGMDEAGGRRNANVSREPGRAFRRAQGTSDGDDGSQKHLHLFYRIRLQNPTPSLSFSTDFAPKRQRHAPTMRGPLPSGQHTPLRGGGAHIRGKDTGFDDAGTAALGRGWRTRPSSTPPQGRGVPHGTSLKSGCQRRTQRPAF